MSAKRYTDNDRRDELVAWLGFVTTDEWVDTMLSLGMFRVRKRLKDGSTVCLVFKSPNETKRVKP